MDKEIYLHSIYNVGSYSARRQRDMLCIILESGKLLSLRKQGYKEPRGFCGLDYISLCDYEKRDLYNEYTWYNGYNGYITRSISLMFPKSQIEVEIPELVKRINPYKNGYSIMQSLGCSTDVRYSDLPDEVQVKDEVSLKLMNGITFPTKNYFDNMWSNKANTKIKALTNEINLLKCAIKLYKYNVPIYDINSRIELTEENIEKLVLKK